MAAYRKDLEAFTAWLELDDERAALEYLMGHGNTHTVGAALKPLLENRSPQLSPCSRVLGSLNATTVPPCTAFLSGSKHQHPTAAMAEPLAGC